LQTVRRNFIAGGTLARRPPPRRPGAGRPPPGRREAGCRPPGKPPSQRLAAGASSPRRAAGSDGSGGNLAILGKQSGGIRHPYRLPWPKTDLAIVDRDRLAKRSAPLRRHKKEEFLFDAVIEFTLVGNTRKRLPASAIARDTKRVRRYLDDLWAKRGYVVVVEEGTIGGDRPAAKPVDALSIHHLKAG